LIPDGENFEGTMILECPKCQCTWLERAQLPMSLDAFLSRTKAWAICPVCGVNNGTMMLTEVKFRETYAEMKKLGVTRL
jgi:hypothetical protein